jgi:hypothetical protein
MAPFCAVWWLQNVLFIADIISNMWLWRICGMAGLSILFHCEYLLIVLK